MYRKFTKRFFDLLFSVLGLLAFAPLLLVVSLLLAIVNRGSPFFCQRRPGRNGIIFRIIKFKTMHDERDESGNLLPDAERVHAVGRLIRAASVDELPQMINVLKGDMSFIGPRPLLTAYLPFYSTGQARRHEVRPGITGWAQVNGRNAISWEQKFEYDVWYVDHLNLGSDLRIIGLTLRKILTREGIDADENTTMVPFDTYCLQSNPRVTARS